MKLVLYLVPNTAIEVYTGVEEANVKGRACSGAHPVCSTCRFLPQDK